MTSRNVSRGRLAPFMIALCGLWLAAGALAKLFLGTPKDLPGIVIEATPLSLDLTFRMVIAVELVIVSMCFFRPRVAWPVVIALFTFFEYILMRQLAAGAESCGCFGATIKVSPWLMLGVDGGLVLLLLVSRPWSRLPLKSPPAILFILASLLSITAPWVFIPKAGLPPAQGDGSASGPSRAGYVELSPATWVRRSVFDIPELTTYAAEEELPVDGLVLLWRQGCEHCAAHLRALAEQDDGTRAILMLQIRDDLASSRSVDLLPTGPHVSMAQTPEGAEFIVQTPWELVVEGGTIVRALSPEELEKRDSAEGE